MKKIILKGSICILFVCLMTNIVNALEQRYTTSINIASESWLQGSARNYAYKYHKIAITPERLYVGGNPLVENGNNCMKLYVKLQKKGFLGIYSDVDSRLMQFYHNNVEANTIFGDHGKGTYKHYFSTQSKNGANGGIVSTDKVYFYSYD